MLGVVRVADGEHLPTWAREPYGETVPPPVDEEVDDWWDDGREPCY